MQSHQLTQVLEYSLLQRQRRNDYDKRDGGSPVEMQLFPKNPLPAPHRTTSLQIITGHYRLTIAHYRQITSICTAFTIRDVYRYRQFTGKIGLFTANYRR